MQAGNRKPVQVADGKTGETFWTQALDEHVFTRHWMDFPTVVLTFDLNFLNQRTGILMDVKLVVSQTDGGMFAVSMDTNRVVTGFGQVARSKILWLFIGIGINII